MQQYTEGEGKNFFLFRDGLQRIERPVYGSQEEPLMGRCPYYMLIQGFDYAARLENRRDAAIFLALPATFGGTLEGHRV